MTGYFEKDIHAIVAHPDDRKDQCCGYYEYKGTEKGCNDGVAAQGMNAG